MDELSEEPGRSGLNILNRNQDAPQHRTAQMPADVDPATNLSTSSLTGSPLNREHYESPRFVLEELPEDYDDQTAGIEVLHPDSVEEQDDDSNATTSGSDSGVEPDAAVVRRLEHLRCDDGSPSKRQRNDRVKRKWKSGLFKRTHSQSAEDELEDGTQAESPVRKMAPMRRMRRRIGSPTESDWVEEFSDGSVYSVPASRASSVFHDEGHIGEPSSTGRSEHVMDVDP